MNKFDISTAKFTSLIAGLCFIFIVLVWHAFDYLPTNEINDIHQIKDEQKLAPDTETKDIEIEEDADDEKLENVVEKVQRVEFEKKEIDITEAKPLETIYENAPEVKTIDNIIKDYNSDLDRARELRNKQQYMEAVAEYQNTISNTEDKALQAQCYEEVAIMYATLQKYDTALSVAQKAYNTKPSTSREVLLARLYYKNGNIDKATSRINNVLRREFSINDK